MKKRWLLLLAGILAGTTLPASSTAVFGPSNGGVEPHQAMVATPYIVDLAADIDP